MAAARLPLFRVEKMGLWSSAQSSCGSGSVSSTRTGGSGWPRPFRFEPGGGLRLAGRGSAANRQTNRRKMAEESAHAAKRLREVCDDARREYHRIRDALDGDDEYRSEKENLMESGREMARQAVEQLQRVAEWESNLRKEVFARAVLTEDEKADLEAARGLRIAAKKGLDEAQRIRESAREDPAFLRAARDAWFAASRAVQESRRTKENEK